MCSPQPWQSEYKSEDEKKIVQYASYLLQYIFWNLNKPIQWKIVYPYSHGRKNKLVRAHGSMKAMAEEPKKKKHVSQKLK